MRKRAQFGIYTTDGCSFQFANTHQERQVGFQLDERAAGDEMKTRLDIHSAFVQSHKFGRAPPSKPQLQVDFRLSVFGTQPVLL